MKFWFISRAHHEEVVSLLKEQISHLRYQSRRAAAYDEPAMEEMPPLPTGEGPLLGDAEGLAKLIETQTRRRDGTDDQEDDGLPPPAIRRSMRKMANWNTRKNAENFQVKNMPAEVEAMLKKTNEEALMMHDWAARSKAN